MLNNSKFQNRLLVAFLGGASLAALSIAAPALAQTLSGAQTVTQIFTGANLNVATDATFSVTTLTGNGINLTSTNSLIFTDNYQSVINGVDKGIYAENSGTGALSLTSTGTATGVSGNGIYAFNSSTGTNLTLTANNVTGGDYGIRAFNYGTGALSITSTGTATGTGVTSRGIYAENSGTDLTVTSNNATGVAYGIIAENYGTGALSLTSTGAVTATGANGYGIFAYNSGTDLTLTSNNVTVGAYGIIAYNSGTGALSITSTGTATATGANGYGIYAINKSTGTNLTLTANNVTGGLYGIYAVNSGTGALSLTSTGAVTATGANGFGIYANNSGTNLTLTSNNVTGSRYGIYADNLGTGALSITSTGTATGVTSRGIYAYNSSTGTNLTLTANNVTGGLYGIHAVNYGTGALSITSTGTVSATGTNGYGILARNYGSGALSLTVSGTVTGGSYSDGYGDAAAGVDAVAGIYVNSSSGSNAINLLSTAVVNSASGRAITASGNTTITFNAGSVVTGAIGFNGNLTLNTLTGSAQSLTRLIELSSAFLGSGEYVIGTVTKSGAGTLTLTGANTYTGGTTISAGTLAVTGKIGAVSVTNGTLQGTGTVGTTTVASGSTLSPGINGAPGTLNVSGNLTMASGSNYAVAVTPTAASKAIVSGSANVNGAVTATFAAGNYTVGQKFAIVESTGLVTGTFASLTNAGALPVFLTDNLSYTSNSVYLNLVTKNLTPLLPTGSASNLTNTATGIDAAVTAGGIPSTGMLALYGQTGATLGTSLTQAQGQVGTNLATSVTQSFAPFLKAMMAQGAPDQGATSRVWGTVYGGHTGISANVTTGAASLSGSNVGLAVGGQKNAADGSGVFGGSIAIGQQNFSSGNGTGISQDLMLGVYGTKTVMDRGYISASLGYGILNVTTTRTLTVSGTDILSGKVNAQEFGGRVEGGYRFSVDDQFGLTPYLAGSLQNIVTPAYVETVQSGTSSFALSYLSQKNTFGRTEAGTHLDRSFKLDDNTNLTAQGTIGWSHQLGYNPTSTVSFQSLSGSSFLLNGIKPANDTAVLGLKLQAQKATGLSYGVRLDSQLGAGTTILQATGNLAYRW
jgi:autotransporter family porin